MSIVPFGRARSLAEDWCRRTSTGRRPTTAHATGSSPRTTSPLSAQLRRIQAAVDGHGESGATAIPRKTPPIEFGRMEPTASDPAVQQQFGMTVGIPNAGQVRALGMINIRGQRSVTCKGDFDKHPSAGPLPPGAPPVCEEFRRQPDALERADGARQAVRPQSRSCGDADVLHPVLVQGPVRHEGYALHRRRRRPLRHGFPGARSHAGRAAAAKGAIIYAKANTTEYNGRGPGDPGGENHPDQDPAVDARLSAQHLGRQSLQLVRHDARRLDRLQFGVRRLGEHEPRDVQFVRGDGPIMPRPGQSQLGGADPAAQGAPVVSRRRDRRRDLQRSRRHSLPRHQRRGEACWMRSRIRSNGYYDPRDIFTTVPRSSLPTEPYAQRGHERQPGRAQRACASASSASSWSSTPRSTSRSSTRPPLK